jgi:hypothetical protein
MVLCRQTGPCSQIEVPPSPHQEPRALENAATSQLPGGLWILFCQWISGVSAQPVFLALFSDW